MIYRGNMDYIYFAAMHTRVDVLVRRGMYGYDVDALASEIENVVAELETVGNRFDPSSELSFVNQTAFCKRVRLSLRLYKIIRRCIEYYKMTGGLFDITVGSPGSRFSLAKELFLYDDHTISFSDRRVRLDLSGVLKGFALDEVGSLLKAHGIEDALVSIGTSSILAIGDREHGSGEGWQVALPNNNKSFPGNGERFVYLHDECLTTSGNDKLERAHIINPLTGEFVKGQHTVSVVTKSGVKGEVLSIVRFLEG